MRSSDVHFEESVAGNWTVIFSVRAILFNFERIWILMVEKQRPFSPLVKSKGCTLLTSKAEMGWGIACQKISWNRQIQSWNFGCRTLSPKTFYKSMTDHNIILSFVSQELQNWEQDIIMLKTLNQFFLSLTAQVFIWDLNYFLKTDEK